VRQLDFDFLIHPPGMSTHDQNPVGQNRSLLDIMGDKNQGKTGIRPQLNEVILQCRTGEVVQCAERLIQQ
jgi:hypothetical protein